MPSKSPGKKDILKAVPMEFVNFCKTDNVRTNVREMLCQRLHHALIFSDSDSSLENATPRILRDHC